jgi:hypothetical protein
LLVPVEEWRKAGMRWSVDQNSIKFIVIGRENAAKS